jgi:hypothetical protein
MVVETDKERIHSTRNHPYWVESEQNWLSAVELKVGMTLRLIDGSLVTINAIDMYVTEESTYNFEVYQFHNYFVSDNGFLVHNGEGLDSGLEDLQTYPTEIYKVTDVKTGKVVYVGQTYRGVDQRLLEHVDDPKSALYVPEDSPRRKSPDFPKNVYASNSVAEGDWTRYEAAVWEQHFIDSNGGKDRLLNRQDAITPEKFQKYRNLHNPCM